jgi:uncharacterized protein (TIGR00369 family)
LGDSCARLQRARGKTAACPALPYAAFLGGIQEQHGPRTISEIIGELGRDAQKLATGPFERLVGYRTRLSAAHGAYVELEVKERHLSQYGIAHGGVALVLLDTVGGVHLLASRPELARIATISLSANFIGPVRPGLVLATAEIQRIGGSLAYTSMALHAGDFEGELLATAHGAYRLFHAAGEQPTERIPV